MKPLHAELLMVLVTVFWGSSYLFMAIGLDSIEVFNLIALRFGLGFIAAGLIFFRQLRKVSKITIRYALQLGFILFVVFTCITIALHSTTTTNAGFLVSLTVIFVPLLNAFLFKHKINTKLTISIVLAIAGIAFLTIQLPFHMAFGDLLCIIAALCYAIHIIVVGRATAMEQIDTLQLGILQLGFAGLFGLLFSLIFETPALPSSTKGWMAILVLSIVCSALGFTLQVIAQKYISSARTGLIFSLEPVFAALFGFLFAQETLSFKGYLGALLVLFSIVISTSKQKNKIELKEEFLSNS